MGTRHQFFVARSTRRGEFRRTATWQRLRDANQQQHEIDIFEQATQDQQVALLATMLSTLTKLDRQLLIGQIWDRHDCQTLAEHHGLSVNAVNIHLTRARAACRTSINKEISEKFADP
jgi:DNA-directed RNA polymerase specialized sigma24 family protein